VRFRLSYLLAALAAAAVIHAAEPMRVGFETNADPMSFLQADGKMGGFTIELIDAISHEMNFPVAPVVGPWEDVFSGFKQGRIDVLASLADTKERAEFIDFAVSHLTMGGALFVRKGERPIRASDEMSILRLAVQPQSFSHAYLTRYGWDHHLVFVPTLREALHALEEGRCDGVAAIGIIGTSIIRKDHLHNIEASDFPLPEFSYQLHMGVHPGNAARLAVLNEGLARIRANGTYDRIYEKWIGPLEARKLRLQDLQPYLLTAALLLATGLGVLIWQRRLLQRLAAQTAALRESELRLTHVLQGSEDGFWDWDLRTGHIERSERWAAMLGYAANEIEPTVEGWARLVHPDDLVTLPGAEKCIADLGKNEGARFDSECRMMTKAGEWRWIQVRGKLVARASDGKPLRLAGTSSDITERKRTDAALRESQQLLKRSAQLLEQTQAASQVGGWEIDLGTDRLFWTNETYHLHEVSPDNFQPTVEQAIDFYTPESRPIIRSALERITKDGIPFNVELEVVTARQRPIRVNATGQAEMENGRVVKIYGSFRDITEQKATSEEREKLQLKMLEAQKLESLGVLAGGIAHDFNNLLTVILANASFARLHPGERALMEERLGHVENSARRMADMCRQMLAYSGRGSFVIEPVSLNSLVQDTARLLLVSISKKARIELTLAPNLPSVEADASQLRQIVMNLVTNASEALGEHSGEIRVSTRLDRPASAPGELIHAFGLPEGDCVCLEVADTGHGMSPTTLARIFDPFFTTKFAGRGLGLAAVLGIVRAHHGALTVKSAPERGTTFQLYLPVAADPEKFSAPIPPRAEKSISLARGTLLIADDEPTVLTTADVILRHHGYKTVLAPDGTEAVRLFRAQPHAFAAVLLDLTMPGLNGAEALREIREINPAAHVLLMSGYSEQDVLARLKDQGPVAILHKPFTHETLLARVSAVVAQ
jgi:two-component system, cell cycle sensor histidine kinase and response regulator CckA